MNSRLMNRLRACAVCAVVVTCPVVYSNAAPVLTGTHCGLGLPPGAPGFAEAQAQLSIEAKTNGYVNVCEENLERYRIAFLPAAPIMAGLSFQPVNLSRSKFIRFNSLGAMSEPSNNTHARLYRGFRMPDGHTVTLFEHDMSVDGSSTWRASQDEPERINGRPARLAVLQARSGDAISHLSWVEGRRAYELWIDANVTGTPMREQLFALAASIPPSVPACPKERPIKPVRMGADGFPSVEPTPMTLTEAEVSAMSVDSKRPCQ